LNNDITKFSRGPGKNLDEIIITRVQGVQSNQIQKLLIISK